MQTNHRGRIDDRVVVTPKVHLQKQYQRPKYPAKTDINQLPESAKFLADTPLAVRSTLAKTVDLKTFRSTTQALTQDDRLVLIDQALLLFEQHYVHLPLKAALHVANPIQRLRLLRDQTVHAAQTDPLSDQQFHREMLSIFLSVRDLHTNYVLPAPYNRMVAFLPFYIEEFYESGQRRYLVSGLVNGFQHPRFKPGVEVVSWNGVPIDRAVEMNGDRFAGSNEAASHARGVETMTIRSLSGSLPPDADWVLLQYQTEAGEIEELRLEWLVFSPDVPATASAELPLEAATALAMDEELQRVREARKILFVPEVIEAAQRFDTAAAQSDQTDKTNLGLTSQLPDILEAREVSTASGKFGYVRIRTFYSLAPNFIERFINEFIRLVNQLPGEGLIIDVRSNGGGIVLAGELLLQLLTPRQITPEPMQFLNTDANLKLAERNDFLQESIPSLRQSVRSGATFSQGFPITPTAAANSIGQIYHGPVVLITDGLCYSTTDIFAAGFQDHKIGPVLGVDNNTGAGGANVFEHSLFRRLLAGDTAYQPLPNGANMRVSIRRSLRVNDRAGELVEDFGVVPDERHFMTRNDVLNRNQDLIDRAGQLLSQSTVYRLDAEVVADPEEFVLKLDTLGLDRLDTYVDGRPFGSVDIQAGETNLTVTTTPQVEIRLEGFQADELVAMRQLRLR